MITAMLELNSTASTVPARRETVYCGAIVAVAAAAAASSAPRETFLDVRDLVLL